MKIVGDNPYVQMNPFLKSGADEPAKGTGTGTQTQAGHGCDKVDLSPEARELRELKNRLGDLPDVRAEKVASLKKQVEEGTYTVEGKKIAGKMILEALQNETLSE